MHGPESRQKPWGMCDFCLPDPPKLGCADLKVDKNRGECVIFVYRPLFCGQMQHPQHQKWFKLLPLCISEYKKLFAASQNCIFQKNHEERSGSA